MSDDADNLMHVEFFFSSPERSGLASASRAQLLLFQVVQHSGAEVKSLRILLELFGLRRRHSARSRLIFKPSPYRHRRAPWLSLPLFSYDVHTTSSYV